MNTLLIFFALPVATIILAIVLQMILRCPLAVAAVFFAIYLIVTFAVFDATFLIAAIIYTILAYIAALLTCFIQRLLDERDDDEWCSCGCNIPNICGCDNHSSNMSNNVATASVNQNLVNNSSNNANCSCRRRR